MATKTRVSRSVLAGPVLGYRNGLDVKSLYIDTLRISPGELHINTGTEDLFLRSTATIDKTLSGLTADTLYYVYIDPPASGVTLSSTDIEISSTAPSFDNTKNAWYHPSTTDWRCIGEFYSKAFVLGEEFGPNHVDSPTIYGSMTIDETTKKWGTGSLSFNGSTQYLAYWLTNKSAYSGMNIPTGNWTLDLWVKHDDHVGIECYACFVQDANNFWMLYHEHGQGIRLYVFSGGSPIADTGAGGDITDTNWHHVALCKNANTYGIYLDGTQVKYLSDSDVASFIGAFYVGCKDTYYFDGNIDDLRIYNGNPFGATPNVGLTDTITVPTAAHTPDADTVILLSGDSGVGATYFERISDEVEFDNPQAIYSNITLQTYFENRTLPSSVPEGAAHLMIETGSGISGAANSQVISGFKILRNELSTHDYYSGAGGQGPTGTWNNIQALLKHSGTTTIISRANHTSSQTNQSCHLWGYKLRR